MKKRILISDIAKALGISVTTVSFILNDKAKEKRISEALTNRVLAYVQEVGYKPNELAKSLRTGKTKIIALIIEDISNPFFANIARLIETKAYAQGYRIIYCSTDNRLDKTQELIELFYDRQVDGFIITPTVGLAPTIQRLKDHAVPLVLFDRFLADVQTNFVVADNFKGANEATTHLFEQGFERVGFVSLRSEQSQMMDRLTGYSTAVEKQAKESYTLEVATDSWEQDIQDKLADFIKEHRIEALLFATNYLAISGLKAAKAQRFKMPAMIAYDDHTLFEMYEPSISVVSQPVEEIADKLISILLNQMQGKSKSLREVVLPCQLKIRESSRFIS